jgi:hypothetical protein
MLATRKAVTFWRSLNPACAAAAVRFIGVSLPSCLYSSKRSLPIPNLLEQLPTPSDGSGLDAVGHRDYFHAELLNSPKGRLFPMLRCTKFKIIPIINIF